MIIDERGIQLDTLAEIVEQVTATFKQLFGEDIDTTPGSVFSQLIELVATERGLQEEWAESVYYAGNPDTASGVPLEYVCAINKVNRLGADFSRVQQLVFRSENPSLAIAEGVLVSSSVNPSIQYTTQSLGVTSNTFLQEIQRIEFTPTPVEGNWTIKFGEEETDNLTFLASASDVKSRLEALEGITSVTVTGSMPTGFNVAFSDPAIPSQDTDLIVKPVTTQLFGNTINVPVFGDGYVTQFGGYSVVVAARSVEAGTGFSVGEGELNVLESSIDGVFSVFNIDSSSNGRDVESDVELRLRRNQTLGLFGKGTPIAIESALRNIRGTQHCRVITNPSTVVASNGRPAKSFEAYLVAFDKSDLSLAGSNTREIVEWRQEVADELLRHVGAGLQSWGSVGVDTTDSQGVVRPMYFSEPVKIPIYGIFTLQIDRRFPSDGVSIVRRVILDYGASLGIGDDVIVYPELIGRLRRIAGIKDIDTKIGIAPNPISDQTIVIGGKGSGINEVAQISDWSPDRITVFTTFNAV